MTEFEQKEIIRLQHKISEVLSFTCNRENYITIACRERIKFLTSKLKLNTLKTL